MVDAYMAKALHESFMNFVCLLLNKAAWIIKKHSGGQDGLKKKKKN